jgi:hypothetical protein
MGNPEAEIHHPRTTHRLGDNFKTDLKNNDTRL